MAIVFVSSLIWLGIIAIIGYGLPIYANAVIILMAVFAIYRLLLI